MGDLSRIQNSTPVQISDDNSQTVALTTSPSGSEVGLVVRNIPYGTQAVSGTFSTTPSGTQTVAGTVTNVPSGTQTVAGTLSTTPSGTQTVAGTVTNVPSGTQNVSVTNTAAQIMTTAPVGTESGVVVRPTGTITVIGTVTSIQSGTVPVSGTVTTGYGAATTTTTNWTTGSANLLAVTPLAGQGAGIFTIHGTYTLTNTTTAQFEASDDGGTTYYPIEGVRTDNSISEGTPTIVSNGSYAWYVSSQGGAWTNVRFRQTGGTVASGTTVAKWTMVSGVSTKSMIVQGDVPLGTVNSGSPLQMGGRAAMTNPTRVADTQRVGSMFDNAGRQVVVQGHVREMVASGNVTVSTTTATSILAAIANTYQDLTNIFMTNTSATATRVDILDNAVVRWSAYLGPSGGQANLAFNPPLKQNAVNTAWTVQLSVAVTDVRVFVNSVKNI